jgi:hypothetical protein
VTFTLSPPVRIAALVGLLAAVLGGGAMTMLGRGGSSEAAPHAINPHPFGTHAKKTQTAVKPAAGAKKHSAAKPAHKPAPKPLARPAAMVAALKAGLPTPLAAALGRNEVVVVSLYNPYSQVDGISFAEARAGAALAGAGFVPLSVLSRREVGRLTEQLGLLPDPGLLIYIRPAVLAERIDGFADKETVAQAAQNAASGT